MPHTLFGSALFIFVVLTAPNAAIWFVPFVAGLILVMPFAVYSSSPQLGEWAERHKLCAMPEEFDMPEEIRAVQAPVA
jgi:membrane glycosyltransferase